MNGFTNTWTIEEVTNDVKEKFDHRETRQTAYYNLSGKVKKFTWQAGLRGIFWLDINSASITDYAVLLPQISAESGFTKEQSLKVTYANRFSDSVGSLIPLKYGLIHCI
jgi:hypothetical protein